MLGCLCLGIGCSTFPSATTCKEPIRMRVIADDVLYTVSPSLSDSSRCSTSGGCISDVMLFVAQLDLGLVKLFAVATVVCHLLIQY